MAELYEYTRILLPELSIIFYYFKLLWTGGRRTDSECEEAVFNSSSDRPPYVL